MHIYTYHIDKIYFTCSTLYIKFNLYYCKPSFVPFWMVSFVTQILLNSVFLVYVCSQWQGNPNAVWWIGRNRNVLSNTHIPQRIQNVSTLFRNITQNVPQMLTHMCEDIDFPQIHLSRFIFDTFMIVLENVHTIVIASFISKWNVYYTS